MNNLFSLFPNFDDGEDFSYGHRESNQPNQSLTRTQSLLNDLRLSKITYEWMIDPIDNDKTIAVYAQGKQLSIHFFMRETMVLYCFYDRTIKKCTVDYEYSTIGNAMENFDNFIMYHYNDANKNPYFNQKYLK